MNALSDVAIEAMKSPYCPLYSSLEEAISELSSVHPLADQFSRDHVKRYAETARNLSLTEASLLFSGLAWTMKNTFLWYQFTPRALIELGKLTPDLRWAAASKHILGLDGRNLQQIDASDLDWRAVRMAERAREKGITSLYFALADPEVLREIDPCIYSFGDISKHITPQYPGLWYPIARRIAMGESPASLAGGLLTRKEAHQWALDGAPQDIIGWLADHLGVPRHRSVMVVRWLAHCRQTGRWSAITRQRRMRIAGQREVRVCSLLHILDEVQADDIVTGRDSVDAVMRRIATRLGEDWTRENMFIYEPLAPIPQWAETLPRGMRLLNTPAELVREGEEMHHCVGSYIPAVRRSECYVLSIYTKRGRSTAEISPSLEIVQHQGPRNCRPPARNDRLLRVFINRIKKGGKDVLLLQNG